MAYTKTIKDDCRGPYKLTTTFTNSGVPSSSTLNGFVGSVRDGQRIGQRVERYKQLISEKRNASSYFNSTRYRISENEPTRFNIECLYLASPSTRVRKDYVGLIGAEQNSFPFTTAPENAALAKLYEKIRQTRSEMNGLQFFGELRQTIRMIKRPADALLKGVTGWVDDTARFYQRNPALLLAKNRKRLQKTVSDSWLEAVFGWQPLISDVQGIAATVGRIVTENGIRQDRVRSRSTLQAATVTYSTGATLAPIEPSPKILAYDEEIRKVSEAQSSFVAFLHSSLSGPTGAFERVSQISGLTFENLAPTIWELTPWSFLIDYFSNIGDCITAEFTDTSSVAFACRTNRHIDSIDLFARPNRNTIAAFAVGSGLSFTSYSTSSGRCKQVRTIVVRTPFGALPTPKLEFTLTNSVKHWANISALLGSRASSIRLR